MNTSCNIIKDVYVLYHDQALTPESRTQVVEHLRHCETCRNYYKAMKDSMHYKSVPTAEDYAKALEYSQVARKLRNQKLLLNLSYIAAILSGILATFFVAKKGK
ncbi:MAG: zf-HC2 domain-containing protein [Firmicutes bacterium]|nr:zf-HC2 domain-containing protein [Bacillota bacterium]